MDIIENEANDASKFQSAKAQPRYEDLTSKQQQRFDYFKPLIAEHGMKVVTHLDPRGRNSWACVYEKVAHIKKASYEQQMYYDSMKENFDVDTTYTAAEVITVISQIRSDLKMSPYLTNVKGNCENDFFNVFIVKDIYEIEQVDGKDKKKFVGYKLTCCLIPDTE